MLIKAFALCLYMLQFISRNILFQDISCAIVVSKKIYVHILKVHLLIIINYYYIHKCTSVQQHLGTTLSFISRNSDVMHKSNYR